MSDSLSNSKKLWMSPKLTRLTTSHVQGGVGKRFAAVENFGHDHGFLTHTARSLVAHALPSLITSPVGPS